MAETQKQAMTRHQRKKQFRECMQGPSELRREKVIVLNATV